MSDIPKKEYYSGIRALLLAQPVAFKAQEKKGEQNIEKMRLLSSIFRSKKSLSKEVQPMGKERCSETPRGFQNGRSCSGIPREFQEDEEVPSTSYGVCEHSAHNLIYNVVTCPLPC